METEVRTHCNRSIGTEPEAGSTENHIPSPRYVLPLPTSLYDAPALPSPPSEAESSLSIFHSARNPLGKELLPRNGTRSVSVLNGGGRGSSGRYRSSDALHSFTGSLSASSQNLDCSDVYSCSDCVSVPVPTDSTSSDSRSWIG